MNLMKMARATVMGVMVGVAAFGLSAGQSEGQAKNVVAQGRAIFMSYCASCHGVEATGQGLVAPALKKQPSDLTRIPKERGRFPMVSRANKSGVIREPRRFAHLRLRLRFAKTCSGTRATRADCRVW
jgi:mono/diheme cytochrome c family protein